jgi:hypothetical protein
VLDALPVVAVRDVHQPAAQVLDVAAQVDIDASFEIGSSYHSFKSTVPGAFSTGFIGSTCIALPG